MKDFNKIKRGFETYYTLLDQGNAKLAQAAELLKKIEEEFNGNISTEDLVHQKRPSTAPNGPYVKTVKLLSTKPDKAWHVKEISSFLGLPDKRATAILQYGKKHGTVKHLGFGKYSYKAA